MKKLEVRNFLSLSADCLPVNKNLASEGKSTVNNILSSEANFY